ncbi:MAG: hypothetical protein K1060chlam4_00734 [Candidatus Anoxychlamydiales bacterium]|nr:hypothetical protein [Candidatus Anoxychlamydiales bacterium]
MDFEKAIDSINISKDQFETIIDFFDIKLTKPSQEKLSHLFNNLFQSFNTLESNNLQKRGVERLSFDFLELSQESENGKGIVSIEEGSNIEKTKIPNILSENKALDKKGILESTNNKSPRAIDEIQRKTLDNPKETTTLKASKSLSNSPCFSNKQEKLVLSFVKLSQQNFTQKSSCKTPKELIDKKSLDAINPNRSTKESLESTIKLNLKLFNETLAQALKGRFELFQTRLIEQPPFGIVAFYVKDKERRNHIKTAGKKRKKSSKKQVKYNEEKFE